MYKLNKSTQPLGVTSPYSIIAHLKNSSQFFKLKPSRNNPILVLEQASLGRPQLHMLFLLTAIFEWENIMGVMKNN